MNLATEARQFLRSTRMGMLSTLSSKLIGYPFGSVAPFIVDHRGHPVILISTIAEHTQNILANPKVSLLVFAGNEDMQASARLTLIGEAKKIDIDKASEHLRSRYLRYFPQASGYFEMHDFNFYRIEIVQARYIAGFGKMSWISGDLLTNNMLIHEESPLAEQEEAIISHMNEDHTHSMIAYCKHVHLVDAKFVKMLGIDCDGFDLKAESSNETKLLRFVFDQPIQDAQSARQALVALSKAVKI